MSDEIRKKIRDVCRSITRERCHSPAQECPTCNAQAFAMEQKILKVLGCDDEA